MKVEDADRAERADYRSTGVADGSGVSIEATLLRTSSFSSIRRTVSDELRIAKFLVLDHDFGSEQSRPPVFAGSEIGQSCCRLLVDFSAGNAS